MPLAVDEVVRRRSGGTDLEDVGQVMQFPWTLPRAAQNHN